MQDTHTGTANLPSQNTSASSDGYESEVSLPRLWGFLRSGRWTIAAFVLAAVLLGVFYLLTTPSIYRTDALVEIQPESTSPLDSLTGDLSQLTGGGSKSPAQAQISIMRSRSVVGKAVNDLGLIISTSANHFPYIGGMIAGSREPQPAAGTAVDEDAGSWFSNFAWSPVSISVSRFEVPDSLKGKNFTLRALGGGKFVLFGPEGERLLEGQTGEQATGRTSEGGDIELFVRDLMVSSPPTEFSVKRNHWLSVADSLAGSLQVAEQGERTGIVEIAMTGSNPSSITEKVNAVLQHYVRQNVEAKSQEAEQSIQFLEKKLPEVKSELDAAEARLASYKTNNQAVDLTSEGQALLDRASSIEDRRAQLEMRMAELRQQYTADHPTMQAAREQLQQLNQARQDLEGRVNQLPEEQKDTLRLQRDVEVNTQLYTGLLNRLQELRVVKAGTVGNVRIIDQAERPVSPISPKVSLVMMLSVVLGLVLGCGYVLLRIAMRRGVSDPQEIENRIGVPVYAVVPFSGWLARQTARAQRRRQPVPILARDHGMDVSVEALRSLRTSLYFAQMDANSSTILITGPAPGVGKSFISSNLAYLVADTGKSVVVVDADMRRGRLHEFLDNEREPGLSQVITGQVPLDDALRPLGDTGVTMLTSGQIPPNPSELLMRAEFSQLLEELDRRFDLVLIDAPPILAVTDAAVIAGAKEGIITFMITRAGMHPISEIEEAMRRMSRSERKVAGVVFNGYRQVHADYGGGDRHYQYEYKSQSGK
ncbi:polysaccharide biosynthesis tyrosine autokinase [Salinisphaera orenii]|uniref:Capsular polysaccharide biosynthesis protein n=1 Tax=Salinisphaera orenii YIM 95161 TaxID=1051139 RepID=A0A423Q1T9_9GAMM|nr:polysaccharide biosynthesis tyrosine autokinase [Salinisphaera halophila]ROO32379.1 capsular polysaccharide biosynthesis protein [Salinisphaera halophila YIM 95161]